MPLGVSPKKAPAAVYRVFELLGSMTRSEKSSKLFTFAIPVVVFFHVVPPSVDFHTPTLPLALPFAAKPFTATYTVLAFAGSTTILLIDMPLKIEPPRTVQCDGLSAMDKTVRSSNCSRNTRDEAGLDGTHFRRGGGLRSWRTRARNQDMIM